MLLSHLKISFFQYFYAFLNDHSEQFLIRYFVIFQIKILEEIKNLTLYRDEIVPSSHFSILCSFEHKIKRKYNKHF